MTRFSSESLKLLRKSRNLSQSEASEGLTMSQGAFSKIEKGINAPSEEQLGAMALFFGVRPEFFFQPVETFDPVVPLQRGKAALQMKVKERIESQGNLWRLHLSKLLDSFEYVCGLTQIQPEGISTLEITHGTRPDSKTPRGPVEIAQLTRRNLKLPRGPVRNLVSILEDHGVFILEFDFETNLLDGFTIVGDGHLPVVFLNSRSSSDRARFTLAHELGHLIMHESVTDYSNVEDEADAFAAEFLMPETDIQLELAPLTLPRLAALKQKWKVSMASLIYRARTLDKISENQSRYLWMQMSSRGYRTSEPVTIAPEYPSLVTEVFEKYQNELGYSDEELSRALMIQESAVRKLKDQSEGKVGNVIAFRHSVV